MKGKILFYVTVYKYSIKIYNLLLTGIDIECQFTHIMYIILILPSQLYLFTRG
jgi:hypothetical protein